LPKELQDNLPSEASQIAKTVNKSNKIRNNVEQVDRTMDNSHLTNENSQASLVDRKQVMEMNQMG